MALPIRVNVKGVKQVITLFSHGAFDENVFILIRAHQDGLER